ncbi:hypothetical protein [Nocardia sp. NPDC059228]|uniref:hypothetical protein n=1 Tax=Nocardia sp. NPDC059228 TaxID=3346777 RepID=UPI003692451C
MLDREDFVAGRNGADRKFMDAFGDTGQLFADVVCGGIGTERLNGEPSGCRIGDDQKAVNGTESGRDLTDYPGPSVRIGARVIDSGDQVREPLEGDLHVQPSHSRTGGHCG